MRNENIGSARGVLMLFVQAAKTIPRLKNTMKYEEELEKFGIDRLGIKTDN